MGIFDDITHDTDRVKVMTSDTDRLPVRELYGTTREMPIMWRREWWCGCLVLSAHASIPHHSPTGRKLIMACNWPPVFANVDNAVIERCRPWTNRIQFFHDVQYIPFNSTFNDSAPTSEAQQFEQRHFQADRHMAPERTQTLARVLMFMFYTKYVIGGMNDPAYVLRVPQRLRLEARSHMHQASASFCLWAAEP